MLTHRQSKEQWQQATAWLEDVRSRTKADIVTYSGLRWQWQRSMNLLEILEKPLE